MTFWIISSLITIFCIASFFILTRKSAAKSDNNKTEKDKNAREDSLTKQYFKKSLAEIERDMEAGIISEEEAIAAKGEIAREILRLEKENAVKNSWVDSENGKIKLLYIPNLTFISSLLLIPIIAFMLYNILGSPNLPSMPLALRTNPAEQNIGAEIDIEEAVKRVEEQLARTPDDARGWSIIAPVYMRLQRYDDAVNALRKLQTLLPPNADIETDLAEALVMANNGEVTKEAIDLLKSAAKRDPKHIRSRVYLASEAMRNGDYKEAIQIWQSLKQLASGSEEWLALVEEGLQEAQANLAEQAGNNQQEGMGRNENSINEKQEEQTPPQNGTDSQAELIQQMVARLENRLNEEGGSIEEWTQLVRSFLVLGEKEKAQQAYNKAKLAYPKEEERLEVDALAKQAGLE